MGNTIRTTILVLLLKENFYDGTVMKFSTINKEYYKLRPGDKLEERLNNLSIIHLKLKTIVDSLRNNSEYSHIISVRNLINNWDKGITIKEIGIMENDAAYVLNKKKMSFCLRKNSYEGELESVNLLTYVAIHELAHIMSVDIGHSDEFKVNFRFLLNYAKGITYLNPITTQIEPVYLEIDDTQDQFCGVKISKNSIK